MNNKTPFGLNPWNPRNPFFWLLVVLVALGLIVKYGLQIELANSPIFLLGFGILGVVLSWCANLYEIERQMGMAARRAFEQYVIEQILNVFRWK